MKLAIIGAAEGQLPLVVKARELGIETLCFAWEQGAVCKPYADRFYPISIFEKERILEICQAEKIDGVVTNASDVTAHIAAYISEKMGLHGLNSAVIETISDKEKVRTLTGKIPGLSVPGYFAYEGYVPLSYPLVVKPAVSSGKKGLTLAENDEQFFQAVEAARKESPACKVLVEEFIGGTEVSVESISYEGRHYVLQFTDKENTGAPHFAETGHHQPSVLDAGVKERMASLVCSILSVLRFTDGASHTEFKVTEKGEIYLIEVNPRGGGDHISDRLVYLSTGYDYLRGMIDVALGRFLPPELASENRYSGIYFLCRQTEYLLPYFMKSDPEPWMVEQQMESADLREISTNYGRNGSIIYRWDYKISIAPGIRMKHLKDLPDYYRRGMEFLKLQDAEENYAVSSRVDLEKWYSKILEKADVLVCTDNQTIYGWFIMYCNDYETLRAYAAGMHVLNEYRGKGLSKKLVENVLAICRQRGFKLMEFYCNNPVAINLFHKYGFMEKGTERVESLGNEIYSLMSLDLENLAGNTEEK